MPFSLCLEHIRRPCHLQAEAEEEERQPTPQASPVLSRSLNRTQWDVRLDSLAAEAMMPLSAVNRRHAQRDRAELTSQISDLRSTVEMQGEMLRRMMDILDEKGKHRAHEEGRPWSARVRSSPTAFVVT